jgi:hypothetical protein
MNLNNSMRIAREVVNRRDDTLVTRAFIKTVCNSSRGTLLIIVQPVHAITQRPVIVIGGFPDLSF